MAGDAAIRTQDQSVPRTLSVRTRVERLLAAAGPCAPDTRGRRPSIRTRSRSSTRSPPPAANRELPSSEGLDLYPDTATPRPLGPVSTPSSAKSLFDQVSAGSLDDAGSDRPAGVQRRGVVPVGRLVDQVPGRGCRPAGAWTHSCLWRWPDAAARRPRWLPVCPGRPSHGRGPRPRRRGLPR